MFQIACEECLTFQKLYSSALRQYSDAMQRQVDFISHGDYSHTRETHAAIDLAHSLCAEQRRILLDHESTEHKKQAASVSLS